MGVVQHYPIPVLSLCGCHVSLLCTNVECVVILAHDDVHPSALGCQITRDLIVESNASTALAKTSGG